MIQTSPGSPRLAAVHLLGQARADLEVAEEDRQARRLAEDAVVGVEQRDRAVLHLVDDRRVRRADQRRRSSRRRPTLNALRIDLGGDRVDGDGGGHQRLLPIAHDERAEGVHHERGARRDDRRRGVLVDDGRPVDDGAGGEVGARRRSACHAARGRRRAARARAGAAVAGADVGVGAGSARPRSPSAVVRTTTNSTGAPGLAWP